MYAGFNPSYYGSFVFSWQTSGWSYMSLFLKLGFCGNFFL